MPYRERLHIDPNITIENRTLHVKLHKPVRVHYFREKDQPDLPHTEAYDRHLAELTWNLISSENKFILEASNPTSVNTAKIEHLTKAQLIERLTTTKGISSGLAKSFVHTLSPGEYTMASASMGNEDITGLLKHYNLMDGTVHREPYSLRIFRNPPKVDIAAQ